MQEYNYRIIQDGNGKYFVEVKKHYQDDYSRPSIASLGLYGIENEPSYGFSDITAARLALEEVKRRMTLTTVYSE